MARAKVNTTVTRAGLFLIEYDILPATSFLFALICNRVTFCLSVRLVTA